MADHPSSGSRLDRTAVLARQITAALGAAGHTVAAAESLTAGALCQALAEAPGASTAFRGGVVAYATELKEGLLGVDAALLRERGPVDARVAAQMAEGVRQLTGAQYGLATTGVAGPAQQDGHEVGTVYVALASPGGASTAEPQHGAADREGIRRAAVLAALELLHGALRPPVE
ncbi:nicotinamide-nucleotide amidohydrolase family protein [Kitasatospora sp. NPDC051914]|uniref:CinA family protein n=1 Tax=Kitasatospora sp. NPDC051914 TaxID=3154945 RepID=UPI003438FC6C